MTVTTADQGAARVIVWDRQARRNAWDLDTMTQVADAVESARASTSPRATTSRRQSRPTQPRGRRQSRASSA
jgi:enoyl-CoA hydratase/carnithine racemase